MPASCMSRTESASICCASAYEPAEGSNPGIGGEFERVEAGEESTVAVGEHRVVERVLRVEVRVQRRLAHPHLAGEAVQGDAGHAFLARQLPRRGDDLGNALLPPLLDLRLGDLRSAYHR